MQRRDFLDQIYHQVVEKDLNNSNSIYPLRVFSGRPKCTLCNERRHLLYTTDNYRYCVWCKVNMMAFRIQRAFRNYIQKKQSRRLDFLDVILLTNYQREMNNGIQINQDNLKECACCNEMKVILDRNDCCFGCKLNIMAFRIQRMYRIRIQKERQFDKSDKSQNIYIRERIDLYNIDKSMNNMKLVE